MPLTETDHQTVVRLREKGVGSEWGARGHLEALRRFGNPTPAEESAIAAVLAGKTRPGGDAA